MKLINERNKTHGDWFPQSFDAQLFKGMAREDCPGWSRMTLHQREALDNILTKIARLLHGDPKLKDHWADIAGYATLGGMDADPELADQEDGEVVGKVSKSKRIRKGR